MMSRKSAWRTPGPVAAVSRAMQSAHVSVRGITTSIRTRVGIALGLLVMAGLGCGHHDPIEPNREFKFRQLTFNGMAKFTTSWSRDGRYVLTSVVTGLMRLPGGPSREIIRTLSVDIATGESRFLSPDSVNEQLPAWSPNGKRISFTWSDPASPWDYVTLRVLASGDTTRLATGRLAAWDPGGTHLAFLWNHPQAASPGRLSIISASGGDPVPMDIELFPPGGDWSAYFIRGLAWSPSGTQIAATVERHTGAQGLTTTQSVWIISLRDSSARMLVEEEIVRSYPPSWPPNGQWIAYGFGGEVRAVNVLTSAVVVLLPYTGERAYTYPCWSPDGRSIACISSSSSDGWHSSDVWIAENVDTRLRIEPRPAPLREP